ncbi:MAG: GAF domain-containing protein [Magnetococcus sp. YQC-5]
MLILVAGGMSGYISYITGQKSVRDFTEQVMTKTSDRIQSHVQNFFKTPPQLIAMNSKMWGHFIGEHRDPHAIEQILFNQTREFNIRSVYYADEQGRGSAVLKEHDGSYQSRIILNPPKRIFYHLDNHGNRSTPIKETEWDPRTRPWYTAAIQQQDPVWSPVYTFTDGILGITASQAIRTPDKIAKGVVAVDLDLQLISTFLQSLTITPSGQAFILEPDGAIIATSSQEPLSQPTPQDQPQRMTWDTTQNSIIKQTVLTMRQQFGDPLKLIRPQLTTIVINNEEIDVRLTPIRDAFGLDLIIGVAIPQHDFMSNIHANAQRTIQITLIFVTFSLLLGYLLHRRTKKHLDQELQHRTKDLSTTQDKLENLIRIGLDLGREQDRMALLHKILFAGKKLLNCDAATLYLATNHKTLKLIMRTKDDVLPSFEIPLYNPDGTPNKRFISTTCALNNKPVVIDDLYLETRFDVSGTKKFDADTSYRTVSMLTVPLAPREGEVIGVLQFINALDPKTGQIIPFHPEIIRFVTAMAAQACVALDNTQLIEAQQNLMDALIQLIAKAIDTKSHYTGNHCNRVQKLAIMLAEAAHNVNEGELANFKINSKDEWREFATAAWLHDCGKVITPEHVVDKATKLETIYNRIHEIRTRFEVLLRDAMIIRVEALASGEPADTVNQRFEDRKLQLINDFAFVATCNLGGEVMTAENLNRLQRISEETWLRHFDDRLGLAHDERNRFPEMSASPPTPEKLLADKPQHIFPRTDTQRFDAKYRFKLQMPEHLYNNGELYNLSIQRGTLNQEERFKVNEHVIQTILMLEELPLPKNLKRVPEFAGAHHETLTGTGYPRGITQENLSIPSRIMAIADIFEALTAADRPYKKLNKISEAIKILSDFKKNNQIDPVLFNLFLTSGVYRDFANEFLLPKQIDEVVIENYL